MEIDSKTLQRFASGLMVALSGFGISGLSPVDLLSGPFKEDFCIDRVKPQ